MYIHEFETKQLNVDNHTKMEQRRPAARRVVRAERHLDNAGESLRLLHRSAAAGAQVGQEEGGEEQLEGDHVQRLGLSQAARDGHQVRLSRARPGLRRVHRSGHRQRPREEHKRHANDFSTFFLLSFY